VVPGDVDTSYEIDNAAELAWERYCDEMAGGYEADDGELGDEPGEDAARWSPDTAEADSETAHFGWSQSEPEPGALDKLTVTDPAAARLEVAESPLLAAEAAHAGQTEHARLMRQVDSAQADLTRRRTCDRDAYRPGTGWQRHYYNPCPSVAEGLRAEHDAGPEAG